MSDFIQVNHLQAITERRPTFVAIGSFDGVHRGHQALLQAMVAAARKENARTAVLTFFPHPKRVILQQTGRYYLAPLPDRVQQLAEQGIDLVITLEFNDAIRHTRAADFVRQLMDHLAMSQLWGGNFAFGYQREGDIPFLQQLGEQWGFSVQLVNQMVEWEGKLVSSSRVRRSLDTGNVADAAGCLGRPFHVTGSVVQGDRRGRTIGFPTANLAVWDELLLPANGVYATTIWHGSTRYLAATNVGVRPTINGGNVTVEAHLLDFDGDLYGESLRLQFVDHIRPEMKFSGLDALTAQIQTDVAQIRAMLS